VVSTTALLMLHIGKEALVAYITLMAVLANVFVLKQITMFGWQASASDVLIIGSVFGLNLLQEYFGRHLSKIAIWTSFTLLFFYTIISQLHLWYTPSASDATNEHFKALFGPMPRFAIASLVTYFVVQHIDMVLYGLLRTHFKSTSMLLRNYSSIALSQLIDTALFGFLGLYGLVDNLGQTLIVSYLVKIAAIFLLGPFILMSKKVIKLHLLKNP
jgi:hypothetical protein